jgi:Flp pilus assembly CpaE family ATPase
MLPSVLIGPNPELNRELMSLLVGVPAIEVVRVFTSYPTTEELSRIIRVRGVSLIFLCVDDFPRVENLAASVEELIAGFPIISISSRTDTQLLTELMRAGIRDHLNFPISSVGLAEAIESVRRRLKKHPLVVPRGSDLYAFLPAKPGVGSSTIAMSISCALAEDLGARTPAGL